MNIVDKNSWKYVVFSIVLMLCTTVAAKAQVVDTTQSNIALKGTVYDMDGQKLQSVSIHIKDRPGTGWATDKDGNFTINASLGDILIFSFTGYENMEFQALKSSLAVEIRLKPADNVLDEAVVVGMGTQRKISLVGAVTSVNVKDLQMPATSLNNLIGGRVPGIISMQNSGEPGKNVSEFWIRGIGTFGANSGALVLVDGLEGTLSQIDPADVESFSVLKDASATAVYGVRGANGVILITTKRGQDQNLQITGRASQTLSRLNKLPDYLGSYDYAVLANEAMVVSGKQPLYNDVQLELIKNGLDQDLYPNVDWQEEILNRTSLQQTYYASARGGGSVARYFLSLGMSNESAAYKQDNVSKYNRKVGYNSYNYRLNLDLNVTKTTSVYMGLDGFNSINYLPGMVNTDWLWSAQAKLTPLTVPMQYSNGAAPAFGSGDEISPYVLLNKTGMSTREEYRNMATLAINQNFDFLVKGLKARVQGAFDNISYFTEMRDKRPDLFNATGRNTNGELIMVKKVNGYDVRYGTTESQWRKYHLESNINYEHVSDQGHRIGGLLYYYMSSEGATNETSSMTAIPKRYQGISSRLTYGYNDTYLVDANFGYTGSENFKRGEQFGFFPSIAVGWVPSQYKYVQDNLPFLNFFKIRASYGTVGNDRISNDRFPYLTIINSNAPGGWGGQGLIESVVGADNLAWEVAKKANLGIEAKMLNNKFEFIVDIFNDNREGIFQRRTQLPTWVGAVTMPYGNVGSMKSYGADGNISYSFDMGRNTGMTLRGNFTYATNKVTNWEQPYQKYDYLSFTDKPYNVLRGFKAIGLFKDELDVHNSPTQFGDLRPGDIKYMDVNGDGVIDNDDRIPLSYSPMPRLMYGFGMEVRHKALTVGVLLRGTGRTDFFLNNNGYGYLPFYGGPIGNVLSIVNNQENRWTPASYSGDPSTENQDALFPRLSYGRNPNNEVFSSFWLSDSRYLRLQEVSINYSLKRDMLKKMLGIKSVDLQLVGYNLAVWDTVKLWDPELANKNGYAYPIPSRFAFQVYVNF
ncbi:SusC/RagA family TonB-linked outer membrane protein [Sphingobacterium sp. SYP-B4668]|uniref:SusC/RagA family TonB-linked outer membrane protein n=1 Tax=Sphingobacterium sp. SYP-B4668 TaxID=2996035 RepID=UPI0022DE92C6|nr:TonB-dependent receptor [Sphingobacterium sp. SYP-B4668]